METVVEVLDKDRAKVTVTVDENTVSDSIKKQYKQLASKYTIPGFRKGKAPRPVIDNMLGKDYVRATVTDEIVNSTYPKAIGTSGVYPIGQPNFGEDDLPLVKDGDTYVYSFEIETLPTLELSDYGPVSIEMPADAVSEEQIDSEIDAIREHYYEITNARANSKVKEDSYVDMKISATDDKGEDLKAIDSDSMQYGIGSGIFPPDFDQELIGLKKGDTKEFTIPMPLESYAMTDMVAGRSANLNFSVEILAVQKKTLPELTDEWVKEKLGIDTVAELKDEIRSEIESQVGNALPRIKESRAIAALEERLEGEIPESVIEDQQTELLQEFFTQLQYQGITLDNYLKQREISGDQFREDLRMQATDMVRQNLALDAYAQHEGIKATDEDILAEFKKANEAEAERLMKEWEENGQMYLIRQGVIRQKAAEKVVEDAQVVEAVPETKAKSKKTKSKAKDETSSEE